MMTIGTALRLGRVSNLPTVCTNAIAGMALAGGVLNPLPLAGVVFAAALAYVAGMFLNDAFDAEMDAQSQRFRPIPAGLVGRAEVFTWGYAMLVASVGLFAMAGLQSGAGWWSAVVGLALAAAILGYNYSHKENPFGPLLMGLCRVLVYLAAAAALSNILPAVFWIGAAVLMAHIIGLTYLAKRESSGAIGRIWPFACLATPLIFALAIAPGQPGVLAFLAALTIADIVAIRYCLRGQIGQSIPLLIAAVSLLDAVIIASQGHPVLAVFAALGFPLTLWLQRWVRGT